MLLQKNAHTLSGSHRAYSAAGVSPPSPPEGSATSLLDMSSSDQRATALSLCRSAKGQMLRVIGSLPGEEVVRAARTALLRALSEILIGPIFIGGTLTTSTDGSGRVISSIPALALHLQALTFLSQRHGLVAPVFGTVPINNRSTLGDGLVVQAGALKVSIPNRLERALLFPGDEELLWNTEAYGVTEVARQLLQTRADAHYSALVVGGGEATELEYQLLSDLSKEFPGRVSIAGFEHSGGIADRLIRRGVITGIPLNHRALSDYMRFGGRSTRGNAGLHFDTDENLAPLKEAVRAIHPDGEQHLGRYLGEVADLLDYRGANHSGRSSAEQSLRVKILQHRVIQFTKSVAPFSSSSDIVSTREELLDKAARRRLSTFLHEAAKAVTTHSDLPSVLGSINPVRAEKPGSILENLAGERFVAIPTAKNNLSLMAHTGAITSPFALFGEDLVRLDSVSTHTITCNALAVVPDSIPGWSSLSRGGVLQYLSPEGKIVAHEELVTISSENPEGKTLPPTERWVKGLRVHHGDGSIVCISEIRKALSLSIPDSWISAEASRVAVFPFSREIVGSNPMPSPHIERREAWESSFCETALAAVSRDIVTQAQKKGGEYILAQLATMADRRSEADITSLKGNDPSFEQYLALHKDLYEEQQSLEELLHLFSSKLLTEVPSSELILQAMTRKLSDNTLTPIRKLESLNNFLHSLKLQESSTFQDLKASIERVVSLAGTLTAPPTGQMGGLDVKVYEFDVPETVFEQCALLAASTTKAPNAASPAAEASNSATNIDPKTHLMKGGGLITNEYTVEYFRSSLLDGGRLAVTLNAQGSVQAFALYYPPHAVPQYVHELHPATEKSQFGYYDILCSSHLAGPTATLAANRRLLLDLQYSETRHLRAIIHESNVPSLKTTFGLGNQISAQRRIVRTIPGLGETVYYEVDFPISPASRSTYLRVANFDRRIQSAAIASLSARSPSDIEHALLHPSPQERAQMSALVAEHGHKRFACLSWGVESMGGEGVALLQKRAANGYLNWLNGVVVTGAGRLAEKRSGTWVLKDSGTLSVMGPIFKGSDQIVPVGLAPLNRLSPWSGRTEEVVVNGNDLRRMAVLYAEAEKSGQISVADTENLLVIRNLVSIPEDYEGNIGIWHVEALRALTLAREFSNPDFVFTAGGGVIDWGIQRVARAISSGELQGGRIILLKGLGGSTDRRSADTAFVEELRRHEQKTGQSALVIVDIVEDPEVLLDL